ncbi:DNA cytosine methyltransferase [Acinetobacter vivianii]|uniref:DNA cytosine methyltransferase n=1 Tax=Acinetobacter vivianii TaxID=1776742 RepID=UPI003B846920
MDYQNNLGGLNELALFAGAGGGILGSHLLGCTTVCAVERDAYAAQVLAQRQNDGILPAFPIWSDIKSFDGRPWRGIVDVISGGFPCQDISSAGKGAGIDGERSGLWSEMARIISEVRPGEVWVENSPMLVSRGLARVISDLAQMGYDAHWTRFSASNFGAPHQRDRLWIVAYSMQSGTRRSTHTRFTPNINKSSQWLDKGSCGSRSCGMSNLPNTQSLGREQTWKCEQSSKEWISGSSGEFTNANSINEQGFISSNINEKGWQEPDQRSAGSSCNELTWWEVEPRLGRVADGVAHRVDRLKAIGNGQVPIVAKSAFKYLGGGL